MKIASLLAFFAVLFLPLSVSYAEIPEDMPVCAAILVDSESSVIYAKNPGEKLPPASTTKLVTAMVALDRLAPDETVVVSANAAKTPSVSPRLRQNDVLTVRDILHLALMRSVNSAAVALAEAVAGSEDEFVRLMNIKTMSIGAEDSLFANSSGLPSAIHHTTVYDLTTILRESLKYPLIREILGKKEYVLKTRGGRKIRVENTDKLLWVSDNLIGGKTGYTREAKHCFVGAVRGPEGTLYAAVLGASTRGVLWLSTGMLLGMDMPLIHYKFLERKKARPVLASYKKAKPKTAGVKRLARRTAAPKAVRASLKSKNNKRPASRKLKSRA